MTNEVLDRAAGFATCAILASAGTKLIGVGVQTLAAGGAGVVPLTLGSLSLLGAGFACQPMDVGGTNPLPGVGGCQKIQEGGYGQLQWSSYGSNWISEFSSVGGNRCVEITRVFVSAQTEKGWASSVCFKTLGSDQEACWTHQWWNTEAEAAAVKWRILPTVGGCAYTPDSPPDPPTEAFDPIPYTDPETNCTYNVQLLGFVEQVSGGTQDPVYVISGSNASRADGGRVGACFFEPTVYYGGSGGGGGFGGGDGAPPFPYVPGDGDDGRPNWLKTLAAALAGAAGAIAADAVADAIQDAFATKYPGLIYRMVSVCEKDASGEPISEALEVPIPDLRAPDAQLARLDAIVELLQASKNFKQPICGNERPKLEGDWVTLRFESDEPSPNSNRVIRKLLRYRSKSGAELGSITDYWRGFTWTTGPVIVTHADAWWGQPKCWAVSADEGKRVLRHAAGEAGIDPDQVGRWIISGSRDPRYGVSLPVKFADLDGGPWVTQRDSPSGPALINR